MYIMNFYSNERMSFADFLYNGDLLNLIIAVYLGAVLQEFLSSVVQGAILPMLMTTVNQKKPTRFEEIVIPFRNSEIKVGEIMMNGIKLVSGFLITYLVLNYVIKMAIRKQN